MPTGRFAPSPTGPLHVGNLRTALVAWLFARSAGARFALRVEDLDPATARAEHEASQQSDLAAIGLDWDGPVVRQSDRRAAHGDAIDSLVRSGATYRCWCTRREIQEASQAAHGEQPEGAYPGTCRSLTVREERAREREGRPFALRLRADEVTEAFVDRLCGPVTAVVDDVVLRRGDGTPAYHLAVVVDDAFQGVGEVVRADDLLVSTPRQIHLAQRLGLPPVSYAHVSLAVAPDGTRLAKRHGAVTLADLATRGVGPADVRSRLGVSLGLAEPGEPVTVARLLERFDPDRLSRQPWVVNPAAERWVDP